MGLLTDLRGDEDSTRLKGRHVPRALATTALVRCDSMLDYLQAGSRFGVTLSAGMIDLLVQAPTLAWRIRPFDTGEIVSLSVALRVSPQD